MRNRHWVTALRIVVLGFVMLVGHSVTAQNTVSGPAVAISILDNKGQDGLFGSVRSVQTESGKLETTSARLTEGPLQLLEVITYDLKGARINNASYLVASSPVGREEYGQGALRLALALQDMQRGDLLVEEYRIPETLDPVLAKKIERAHICSHQGPAAFRTAGELPEDEKWRKDRSKE